MNQIYIHQGVIILLLVYIFLRSRYVSFHYIRRDHHFAILDKEIDTSQDEITMLKNNLKDWESGKHTNSARADGV